MAVNWISLGCWGDREERAVPSVDDILKKTYQAYTKRDNPITLCAEYAYERGFSVFAVQNGGWCATSSNAENTYKKYGSSNKCKDDGEGGIYANAVYKLVREYAWKYLGCWTEKENARSIPNVDPTLTKTYGPYSMRKYPIQICAEYAHQQGYSIFAIQNGGLCATGRNAEQTYRQYGPSDNCKPDGEGGNWANEVYKLVEENTTNLVEEKVLTKPTGMLEVLSPMIAGLSILIAVLVIAFLVWWVMKKRSEGGNRSNENVATNVAFHNVAADKNPARFNNRALPPIYAVIEEGTSHSTTSGSHVTPHGEGTSSNAGVSVEGGAQNEIKIEVKNLLYEPAP